MQPCSIYSGGTGSEICSQSVSVGPTHNVARGQSCGSRDVAYRRPDPNRYCRDQVKDIVSKHVSESVQNIISNLRGGGRERARVVSSMTKKRKNAQRGRVIKRGIFL